jgi:tRNA(Ile)-lysidine synthase
MGIIDRPMMDSILANWPKKRWETDRVIIAVSGGADSMGLLECLWQTATKKENLLVFHCNHRQRGAESDADALFVQEQATLRQLPCHVARLTDEERENHSEDQLRRIRYEYLKRFAIESRATWIALGHNADDNIETFFHRLSRGSGLRGLRGIPPERVFLETSDLSVRLIRPLLKTTKATILEWLQLNQVPFRHDSSNDDSKYTRNRIRKELIPSLNSVGTPDWKDIMLQFMELISQEHEILNTQVRCLLRYGIAKPHPEGGVELAIEHLLSIEWDALRELLVEIWHEQHWPLRDMSRKHWLHIRDMIHRTRSNPHPMRVDLPGAIRLEIRKGKMRVYPTKS